MALNIKHWLRICLLNLFIVGLFGAFMRYKIGFEFPYLNQKHLQHGHSHFAFIGWVTQCIFILMAGIIQNDRPLFNPAVYRRLLAANLICAYGMLVSFTLQGYGAFSIAFSTLSVVIAYTFAHYFFKDLKGLASRPYALWFTAALWFNIISSVGTFTLAFMMASHNFNQNMHLASLYFYLHFQYNGFFTFAGIGLFLARLNLKKTEMRHNRLIFWLFFAACIPAYFLSVLWARLPVWLFTLVAIAAIAQVVTWVLFVIRVRGWASPSKPLIKSGRYIFTIIAIALSIKFLLQLGSTVPSVSKLAFGFRPIVIAYLHLVLLAIVSVFLLGYAYFYKLIAVNRMASAGLALFVIGVYLNEMVLGVQGIASFSYTVVPLVNETLFYIALLILASLLLLLLSQRNQDRKLA